MPVKTAQKSGIRLILTLNRTGKTARDEYYDITDSVVELGPLCSGGGGVFGEPQAESIRLRLFGEDRYNPRKPESIFRDYERGYLDVYKDGAHLFFGALSGPPRLEESAEQETITLHFVGGLKELWPQQDDDFVDNDIEYADVERDLWPLLVDAARLPITKSLVDLTSISTTEDVWSTAGRPHIVLPGYDREDTTNWDVVCPVENEAGEIVYAGFGPFILSYEHSRGKWATVAVVAPGSPAEWLISHLEYDATSGELCGVAAMNEDDITLRAAHTRARFTLAL